MFLWSLFDSTIIDRRDMEEEKSWSKSFLYGPILHMLDWHRKELRHIMHSRWFQQETFCLAKAQTFNSVGNN